MWIGGTFIGSALPEIGRWVKRDYADDCEIRDFMGYFKRGGFEISDFEDGRGGV